MNGDEETVIRIPRLFSREAVRETMGTVRTEMRSGSRMVLDFSEAENMDSFGVGQLIAFAKEAKESGVTLTLRHLGSELYQMFSDTGLDQIFIIEGVKQEVVDLFSSSADLRLEITQEPAGDVCIFRMKGVMDHVGGSHYFRQQLLLSLASHRKILLDLSDLAFFDSLSVSVLLDMNNLLKETGAQLRICAVNYIIEDLFNALNLNALIPLFPTREKALADWQ